MAQIIVEATLGRLRNLIVLIRILPVLSWGITSSLIGLGFAIHQGRQVNRIDFVLIMLFIVFIHGILSHAINDREDWISGTDRLSPGILSGGSGVVARGQFTLDDLSTIAKAALFMIGFTAAYFVWRTGVVILIFLALGFFAAVAYSCGPLRLAYRPFLGEWLCGFPAVSACAVGTFYVLTGTINGTILWAGAIHALLAIGLLMHHHQSDIDSDLQAFPRKYTTVAMVSLTMGRRKTIWVGFIYFLLAVLAGIVGAVVLDPVFWVTVPAASGCMLVTATTIPDDILNITAREYLLYALIIAAGITQTGLLIA